MFELPHPQLALIELLFQASLRNREGSPHARFVHSRREEPPQPYDRLRLPSNQIAQPRSLARKDVEHRFGHRLRAWSLLLLPANRVESSLSPEVVLGDSAR